MYKYDLVHYSHYVFKMAHFEKLWSLDETKWYLLIDHQWNATIVEENRPFYVPDDKEL